MGKQYLVIKTDEHWQPIQAMIYSELKLNRFHLVYGRYKAFIHKIGLVHNPSCTCREPQTLQRVLTCMDMIMQSSKNKVNIFRDWLRTCNINIWLSELRFRTNIFTRIYMLVGVLSLFEYRQQHLLNISWILISERSCSCNI